MPQIRDPRIAMAVPRRSGDLERERVIRELRAIREARELYVAAADPEANAMRSGMQEREESLRSEMGRRQALSYSQGRIYTQDGIVLRPAEAFADESAATWTERLAGDLFDKAFPTLPLGHDLFPDTLAPERIQAVFRGIFNGDPEAAGTAGNWLVLTWLPDGFRWRQLSSDRDHRAGAGVLGRCDGRRGHPRTAVSRSWPESRSGDPLPPRLRAPLARRSQPETGARSPAAARRGEAV